MKINKGLNLHNTNNNKEAGSWSHALNVEYSKDLRSITNSTGNVELDDALFESEKYRDLFKSLKCIGTISTPNEIVLFMVGDMDVSSTYYYSLSVWRLKENELSLLFYTNHYSKEKEIIGTYKYNYKKELIIAFCNGVDEKSDDVIVINLDTFGLYLKKFGFTLDKYIPAESLLKAFSISPHVPLIKNAKVEIINGDLPNGVYEFFMSYIKDENNISYQPITNKIIIGNIETTSVRSVISKTDAVPEAKNTHYEKTDHVTSLVGVNSYLGVKLKITFDSFLQYEKANVICRCTNESNVVSYYFVEEFSTLNSEHFIVFKDINDVKSVGESILLDTIKIKKSKSIESHKDRLYLGNYSTFEADNKKLEYFATGVGLSVVENRINNAKVSDYYPSFQPGEVYAFYIHFIDKYGMHTKGYHIPFNQYTNENKNASCKFIQAFNENEYYKENDSNSHLGWFGIKDYTTNKTQKVVHHFISDSDTTNLYNKRYGIKVNHIPNEEEFDFVKNNYVGFYISFAKKNYNNSRVLSTGALFSQGFKAYGQRIYKNKLTWDYVYYPKDDPDSYFPRDSDGKIITDGNLRFIEAGLLYNEPKINPNELSVLYEVENNYTNNKVNHYSDLNFISNKNYIVNDSRYLLDNNSATTPSNIYKEKTLYIYSSNAGNKLFEYNRGNTSYGADSNHVLNYTEFYVAQLIDSAKKDFHYGYDMQKDLIMCTDVISIDNNSYNSIEYYNGGSFYGMQEYIHAFHAAMRYYVRFYAINRFIPAFRKYAVSSDMTLGIDKGNLANSRVPINNYTYNNGFHEQVYIKVKEAFNRDVYDKNTTSFPMNVARSRVQQTESLSEAWTQFDALEYRTLNEKREEIISLKSDGRNLYVQAKTSLFIMQTKDELKTANEITVALSDSDMFANEPLEVMYDDKGLIGCNSRFANTLTPIGYMVFDSSKDSIYLVQNGTPKLISENIYELRNKWKDIELEDDPAITERGNRLFLDTTDGKNLVYFLNYNNENSFNLSYNLNASQFVSFHNFVPLNIASTRKDLFSIEQVEENSELITKIFKYNQGIIPRYNNIVYPSYIDVVLNNEQVFKLQSIFWDSNFRSTNNVEQYDKTFSDIALYNNKNCTGLINLKKGRYTTNRGVKNMWYFNNIRDNILNKNELFIDKDGNFIEENLAGKDGRIKNFFDRSKFFSNFVVVRLYYNNEEELKFYLNELKIKAQI